MPWPDGRPRRSGATAASASSTSSRFPPGKLDTTSWPARPSASSPPRAALGAFRGRRGADARRVRRAQRRVPHPVVVTIPAGTVVAAADRGRPPRRRRGDVPAARRRRRRGLRGHRRRAVRVGRRRVAGRVRSSGARRPGRRVSSTSRSTSSSHRAWQIGHQQAIGDARLDDRCWAPWRSAATTPGCAPKRGSPAGAARPSRSRCTSPAASRCTTSARSRTTPPRTPPATCCSRARCRTRRRASTRA